MEIWVVFAASVECHDHDYTMGPDGPLVGVYDDERQARAARRNEIERTLAGWEADHITGVDDVVELEALTAECVTVRAFVVADTPHEEVPDGGDARGGSVWLVHREDGGAVSAYRDGPSAAASIRARCQQDPSSLPEPWRISRHDITRVRAPA